MSDLKIFIEALKTFLFDFLGYLIPGLITIVLTTILFGLKVNYKILSDEYFGVIFFVFSYALGYVLYGLTEFVNKRVIKHHDKFDSELLKDDDYKLARKILFEKGIIKSNSKKKYNARSIRSHCMSVTPEYDDKIYLFTFRSVLSNQLSVIFMLLGSISIVLDILKIIFNCCSDIRSDVTGFIMYILLITFSYFLYYSDLRFYRISMRMPYSLFITKEKLNKNEN